MDQTRRSLIKAMLATAGMSAAPPAFADSGVRSLHLVNLHTGERLAADYFEAGRYLPDALRAFDHLLRDHRTGESHAIAPSLLDLAAQLSAKVGAKGPIQIISGYRSAASNASLRRASAGVATHSLHMEGKALDIRIPGVDLRRLKDLALGLRAGGVGFYPSSDFVHVDVGRVRQW